MRFLGKLVPPNITTTERDALVGVDTSSIIYNSTTGRWEWYNGISWVPLIGSIDQHTDVDTTTAAPVAGDQLTYNGTNWVPSSAAGNASGNNYVFAHSEHFQGHSATGAWRAIAYNVRDLINGWTYTEIIASGAGTSASPYIITDAYFTVPAGGLYGVTIECIVGKPGGGSPNVAIRGSLDNVSVDGSQNGMDITSNNTTFSVSRTFIMNTTTGQQFRAEWATSATVALLYEAPTGGGALTAAQQTSAAITIRRLT